MDSGGFVENLDHTQMFKNLMHLCENPDLGFYFVDDVYVVVARCVKLSWNNVSKK